MALYEPSWTLACKTNYPSFQIYYAQVWNIRNPTTIWNSSFINFNLLYRRKIFCKKTLLYLCCSTRYLFKEKLTKNKQTPEMATYNKICIDKKTAMQKLNFKKMRDQKQVLSISLRLRFFISKIRFLVSDFTLPHNSDRLEHTDTTVLSHFPFLPPPEHSRQILHQRDLTDEICH